MEVNCSNSRCSACLNVLRSFAKRVAGVGSLSLSDVVAVAVDEVCIVSDIDTGDIGSANVGGGVGGFEDDLD